MKKSTANRVNGYELAAKKAALIARLTQLFGQVGAQLEPMSANIELNQGRTRIGIFHADCTLVTSEGRCYYFCFGYDRAKEMEHPFFIRLVDSWFKGNELVAPDRWLYTSLSEVMNVQGAFIGKGITARVKDLQLAKAA